MEDSGIDSEDRQSSNYDETHSTTAGSTVVTTPPTSSTTTTQSQNQYVPPGAAVMDFDVAFRYADGISQFSPIDNPVYRPTTLKCDEPDPSYERSEPPNTCRILQRKLELKVERAKRNYTQYQEEQAAKTQAAVLIPINRLPIPNVASEKPLVDYQTGSSDNEDDYDDEAEEISFFPAKLKHKGKNHKNHELTDTFSIQEMTIESDCESDDSVGTQNLELLLPSMKTNLIDKLRSCFGCSHGS